MTKSIKQRLVPLIPTLRIKSVSRISLEDALLRQFKKLKPGVVLDAGSQNDYYKKLIPHAKYLRLDINKRSKPDICCDLHKIKWRADYFDTVLSSEVIEHLYNPPKAIDEIYRVLKPGGVCILSTRFIYPYHPDPKDYYRFTQDSLKDLFNQFSRVKVYPHGNRIQAFWQIFNYGKIGAVLNLFNPIFAKIQFKDNKIPCGFVVWAVK